MTSFPSRSKTPVRRVGALHRQGGLWRLVVVEKPAGTTGPGVKLIEASYYDGSSTEGVLQAIERLKVERLIRVLPASSCISRALEVPEAPENEMMAALPLLAEAHLPAGVPSYRRAWGLIPAPASDGARAAMVLGWPGEPGPEQQSIAPDIESWTSELVALAGLVEPRRSTLALYADRDNASVALLAWNGTRASVRAVRETGTTDEAWNGAVVGLLTDAAGRYGVDAGSSFAMSVSAGPRTLWLDTDNRSRVARLVAGAPTNDPAWLRDYAVAAGAAAAYLSAGPSTQGLFGLTPSPVVEERSKLGDGIHWLVQPRRAVQVLVWSVAILLLLPLATAFVRKAIYQSKAQHIDKQQAGSSPDELERQLAFYSELQKRRWPMTKLVADLAQVMPLGVTAENIQLDAGQRFTLRGRAESLDVVSDFKDNINATGGVFADAEIGRTQPKGDMVEFDISGRVDRPLTEAKGLVDFAEKPLAVQLYGEAARSSVSVSSSLFKDAKDEKASSDSRGSGGSGGSGGDRKREVFDKPKSKAAEPVPPALTDEQIKAMERSTLQKEFAQRKKASTRPDISAADKQRLKDEYEKLKTRLGESKTAAAPAEKPAEPKPAPKPVEKKPADPPPADGSSSEDGGRS